MALFLVRLTNDSRQIQSIDKLEIGCAFTDIKGKLYPAVSLDAVMLGGQVCANFGGSEFEFKGNLRDLATFVKKQTHDYSD
jgi:hypothetical protein